jgi:hypothetical protein
VRLNPADGTITWSMPKLSEVFAAAGPINVDRLRVVREQMPNGESFDPTETLALASPQGDSVILVQRSGAMAALSATDGKTVMWSHGPILQQVHFALLRDGVLVLAGLARDVDAGQPRRENADAQQVAPGWSPRIAVLDPQSGRPAFGSDGMIRLPGRAGVKWMVISPLGTLVYGSAETMEAFNLWSGERLWANAASAAVDSQHAWCTDRMVVFEDQRTRLRSVRLADGVVSESFEPPLRGEWDPMELRDMLVAGDLVIGHYRQRIVMYDPQTGRVAGADAVTEDRDFKWLVRAEDRLLAVSTASFQGTGNGPGGAPQNLRRVQYGYKVYAMSLNGKAMSTVATPREPLPERVQQVFAIDNWLLLSTLTDTLAVPMPAK